MTSRTRWKLNEASFFLGKLEEHYYDHLHSMFEEEKRPPTFSFCLSAFVSAARSVMWVMRHEYVGVAGWEEWFKLKGQETSPSQRELLKLFNDLRVRSEKLEPLPIGQSVRFVGDPDVPPRNPKMPKLKITISAVDEAGNGVDLGEVAAFLWTLDELDGEDLLPACKDYVSLLSSTVEECEMKFGIRQSYEPLGMSPRQT
jgi:hypothetical protein